MTDEIIHVCCAIIPENGRILAVQRGPGRSHAGQWEFPGGKIQENESPEACIVRELEEELSVTVAVAAPLVPVEFTYGSGKIRLMPFVCRITSGTILLTEHVALKWLGKEELEATGWSGADAELVQKNRKGLMHLMQGPFEIL